MTNKSSVEKIRTFLLFFFFALSFGGFTFYAAIVVPIGTDVLDATTQGFVTQRVTQYINYLNALTAIVFIWNGCAPWKNVAAKKWYWRSLGVYVVSTVVLFLLHPLLTDKLDIDVFDVKNPSDFYHLHAAYLWISTAHWLAALLMLTTICYGARTVHENS